MDAEWITSPTARRILVHWADPRPAWLWSHDGTTLLWRNNAARLFNGRVKKSGVRLAAEPVPIKGLVARLIRLGSLGRSSLSRVQFLAGDRPCSTTCSCTPLPLPDGETALLLLAIDPLPAELRETAADLSPDAMSESLFPPGWTYRLAPGVPATLAEGEIALAAGAGGETLVFSAAPPPPEVASIDDVRAEEGVEADVLDEEQDLADMPEPMLPLGIEPVAEPVEPAPPGDEWADPGPVRDEPGQLSSLFDRLAGDADLYSPLTAEDERFEGDLPPAQEAQLAAEEGPAEPQPTQTGEDMIAAVIEYSDDPEASTAGEIEPPLAETRSHWLITGRGFRSLTPRPLAGEPDDQSAPPPADEPPAEESTFVTPGSPAAETAPPETAALAEDAETADRVSRYNFEELGRILSDRVANEPKSEPEALAHPTPAPVSPAPNGIINLNAETLVLNRLPLAILVFRDQQVLFANRALTDLLGHESVESLRAAGIASIFPLEDNAAAGPVNRLVRRDGTPLNVTARLQSVSWQGRAALMLSASSAEPSRGHEGAVRAFAEIAAEARGEGYVSADRAGVVTFVSAPGRALLGRTENELAGRPLAVLVGKSDMEPLRLFLERPARFAETARPAFVGVSENGDADIVLFAEGQAGIVSGYFGFVKKRSAVPATPAPAAEDFGDGLLGRLSRGIRRPLNTIIGFADLIRSSGMANAERTEEYARDIRSAGLEIAVLADELDDFTRLRDGRYAPRPSDLELGPLLENCVVRVRGQAGNARVLVRSAISEKLPRVRADRSSLSQALLNLLASAIEHTPVGGSVILSAHSEDDGAIAIHVRDGAQGDTDPGDRFVVFRDGTDQDGEQLAPVRSTVGLALTRSLLAVNSCSLAVDPTATTGTLFSLRIPADAVVRE